MTLPSVTSQGEIPQFLAERGVQKQSHYLHHRFRRSEPRGLSKSWHADGLVLSVCHSVAVLGGLGECYARGGRRAAHPEPSSRTAGGRLRVRSGRHRVHERGARRGRPGAHRVRSCRRHVRRARDAGTDAAHGRSALHWRSSTRGRRCSGGRAEVHGLILAGPSAIEAPRRVCLVSVSLSCHNRARVPGSCHAAAIARTT